MKTNSRLTFLYHLLFCTVVVLTDLFYFNNRTDIGFSLDWALLPITIAQLLIFYINSYWLFPRFFSSRKYVVYGVSISLFIMVFSLLSGYITNQLYPIDQMSQLFDEEYRYLSHRLTVFIKRSFMDNSIMAIFSFAFSYYFIWKKNEQERIQLKEENLKSELSYLSAQLDPHFLFNTLNTLYSLALKGKKKDIGQGIDQLTLFIDQMSGDEGRYMTTVREELDKIENYIRLQKLRFSKDDPIDIGILHQIDQPDTPLASRILIPLVENSFKHGISLREPSFIHINVYQKQSDFSFTISNSDHAKTNNEQGTGIGLENIKKRLELLYRDNFSLEISDDSRVFKVSLTIKTEKP
ncbi:MAG: histidine kinase [Roseivirga sp.]|nr:histidine kinase [Roseivirga sp.]